MDTLLWLLHNYIQGCGRVVCAISAHTGGSIPKSEEVARPCRGKGRVE